MKNRAIMLLTVFVVLYAGFNLPSCDSEVAQIALTDAHITEAMTLAAPLKIKIERYFSSKGSLPLNNKTLGVPLPGYINGNAVHSIRIQGGYIKIKFKKEINNGLGFQLKPTFVPASPRKLEWLCQIGNIDQKFFSNLEPSCLTTQTEIMNDLMLAIHQRDYDKIEQALDNGADINGSYFGETPLMRAIFNRKEKLAKYLIEQGADVELTTSYYQNLTPLMYAIEYSGLEMVKLLVKNGANVNAQDEKGKKVVDFVKYNTAIKDYLYENGADGAPEQEPLNTF